MTGSGRSGLTLRAVVAALAVLAVPAVAACSGGSSAGRAPAPASPSIGTVAGGTEAGGTAYRFDLPTDPAFEAGPEQVTAGGTATRSWRFAVAPDGPYCFVTAYTLL